MKLSQLSGMYQRRGPFASATIAVSHDDESGAHEHELRVRAVVDQLEVLGADARSIEAVAARLGEKVTEQAPVGRTVVAADGQVVFDELIFSRVDDLVICWGPLPEVTRWVEHQDGTTPFVLARVDHEGGDVATYTSDVPEPDEEQSVGGETYHVHRVPVGGWSALRYQHDTENVWRRNADAVADEVARQVRRGHPLVLLAGDPRSLGLVREALGDIQASVVQLESGGRAEDGGGEALAQAIREVLLEYAVGRRLQDSHELEDRLGEGRAVATGVRDVADAFVRGQVETLLIDPMPSAEASLVLDEHPGLLLGDVPTDQPLRADLAMLAAAATTSGDVRVTRAATLGGAPVAALLRWDQEAADTAAR